MEKIEIIDPISGEEVTVTKHPNNKVPVTELPDMTRHDRRLMFGSDLPGKELPVLIRSSFRADPTEGDQGTFTKIVEEDCGVCGYDRADFSYHTLAGVGFIECRACRSTIKEL
jgi:hypothetical protein